MKGIKLTLILAIAISSVCHAERINLSLASKHSSPLEERELEDERMANGGNPYNEINPGIGIELDIPGNRYALAGVLLKDSLEDHAVYAGVGNDFYRSKYFALCGEGIFIFGPNNYAALQVCGRVSIKGHGLKIGYSPAETLGTGETDVVTLQYQLTFD